MAKFSSLHRSNAMHARLIGVNAVKASRLRGTKAGDRASIIQGYHEYVRSEQIRMGRVLSKKEKKYIFKDRFDLARERGWYKD